MKKSFKWILTTVFVSLISFALSACKNEKFNVTLNVNQEHGEVSGAGAYAEGDLVTITAVANSGYEFLGWFEEGQAIAVSTVLAYTFKMPAKDVTYEAKFDDVYVDAVLDSAKTALKISGVGSIASNDFVVNESMVESYQGKDYTISISWVSSNTDVISLNGLNASVLRPAFGLSDENVTLTATLSLNGKSTTKDFTLLVMAQEETVESAFARIADLLENQMAGKGLDNVTENLSLPSLIDIATITWTSKDLNHLTHEGVIIKPINGEGDATVILTASIIVGGATKDVNFTVIVKEGAAPIDELKVEEAIKYLSIPTKDVISNLDLALTGYFGTTITWESSNEAVIATNGKVTRQKASGVGFTQVLLTATVSYPNQVSLSKVFIVEVLELEPANDTEKIMVAYHNLAINLINVSSTELTFQSAGIYEVVFTYDTTTKGLSFDKNVLTITRGEEDYFANVTVSGSLNGVTECFEVYFVVKSTSKGDGSLENPFVVTSIVDLEKVGTELDGWSLESHYALYSDIDMSLEYGEGKKAFTPIGNGVSPFKGSFEGNGFTIYGLYVDTSLDTANSSRAGLFGQISGGRISNLTIEDATVYGYQKVGGLVGAIYDGSIFNSHIVNSHVEAKFIGDAQTGNLIGYVDSTEGEASSFIGRVYIDRVSATNGYTYGQFHVGGLIGRVINRSTNYDAEPYYLFITNAYSSGVVEGERRVGGLIGSFSGYLENAVSTVTIKPSLFVANNYGTNAGLIGAIEPLNASPGTSYINSVIMAGDITKFIEVKTGRTASLISDVNTHTINEVVVNVPIITKTYISIEPYTKNGNLDYSNGVAGTQTLISNLQSLSWLSSNMNFDFDNVWDCDGDYPKLKSDKTTSLIVSSVNSALRIPTLIGDSVNLITNTNIDGIVVSWSTTSTNVDVTTGDVIRPAFGQGNLEEQLLTATYTYKGETYILNYVFTILETDPTTEEKNTVVETEISTALGSLVDPISKDLLLLDKITYGEITWTVNEGPITTAGAITRPSSGQPDAPFSITASVVIDGITKSFTYEGTILAERLGVYSTNAAKDSILLEGTADVDIELPITYTYNGTEGADIVSITWSVKSGNSVTVNEGVGVVSRPAYADGDETVILTATFTSTTGYILTSDYTVVVSKQNPTSNDLYIEAEGMIKDSFSNVLSSNVTLPTLQPGVSVNYIITAGDLYLQLKEDIIEIIAKPSLTEGRQPYTITVDLSATASDEGSTTVSDTFTITGEIEMNFGNGTSENPFKIATVADFISGGRGQTSWVSGKYYELLSDIDFSADYNALNGKSVPQITVETTLNGNGFTIYNFYQVQTVQYTGMFKSDKFAIFNINFDSAYVKGTNSVGLLSGRVRSVTAHDIKVTNSTIISTTVGDSWVGGLIGQIDTRGGAHSGEIYNIYIEADVSGEYHAGLFLGNFRHNEAARYSIHDIELHGTLTAKRRVGSFIGAFEFNAQAYTTDIEGENLKAYNIVSYGIVLPSSSSNTSALVGGLIGNLELGNKDVNYSFSNMVYYGNIDSALFTAGYVASAFGKTTDARVYAMCDLSTIYVNQTPFMFNALVEVVGESVGGIQLDPANIGDVTWYNANLASFSSTLWDVTETGLVLK